MTRPKRRSWFLGGMVAIFGLHANCSGPDKRLEAEVKAHQEKVVELTNQRDQAKYQAYTETRRSEKDYEALERYNEYLGWVIQNVWIKLAKSEAERLELERIVKDLEQENKRLRQERSEQARRAQQQYTDIKNTPSYAQQGGKLEVYGYPPETTFAILGEAGEKLKEVLERYTPTQSATSKLELRSIPLTNLTPTDFLKTLGEKDFFDRKLNPTGAGIINQYESIQQSRQAIIIDHATGLMWQQSGSDTVSTYTEALQNIRITNDKKFGGYADWRLSTLEEAMSLMEPTQKNSELYIDPIFDKKQTRIWTADKGGAVFWAVDYEYGFCFPTQGGDAFVRAVRSRR